MNKWRIVQDKRGWWDIQKRGWFSWKDVTIEYDEVNAKRTLQRLMRADRELPIIFYPPVFGPDEDIIIPGAEDRRDRNWRGIPIPEIDNYGYDLADAPDFIPLELEEEQIDDEAEEENGPVPVDRLA